MVLGERLDVDGSAGTVRDGSDRRGGPAGRPVGCAGGDGERDRGRDPRRAPPGCPGPDRRRRGQPVGPPRRRPDPGDAGRSPQGRARAGRPGHRLAGPPGARGRLTVAVTARPRTWRSIWRSTPPARTSARWPTPICPRRWRSPWPARCPDPSALPETALLLPRLPYRPARRPGQPGAGGADRGRPVRAARAVGRAPSCSSATARSRSGRDPSHAVDRLELVEVLCRTWRDALLIRAALATVGIVDAPKPRFDSRRDR